MNKKSLLPVLSVALSSVICTSLAQAAVISHWTFDVDTQFTDSVGSNHGTASGTAAPTITTTAAETKFGTGAANIGSNSSFISLTSKTFAASDSFSVAFWARSTVDGWAMVLGQNNVQNHYLGFHTSNDFVRIRGNDLNNVAMDQATATLSVNTWHHYVIAVNSSHTTTMYVDGVAKAVTQPSGGDGMVNNTFTYDTIGRAFNTEIHDITGQVDEMWIFDTAIDQATVTSLMTTNAVPEPSSTSLLGFSTIALILRRRR